MRLFSIPFRQKKQAPVIYQLGWWAHQQALEVTSFEVTVIKSQLNLLNSTSVISYTVKGWLRENSFGTPYIQSIHHSEQLTHVQNEFFGEQSVELRQHVHARIQLTPIVGIKNTKNRNTGRIPFECTNEYNIRSLRWGANNFQFSCEGIENVICLSQRK